MDFVFFSASAIFIGPNSPKHKTERFKNVKKEREGEREREREKRGKGTAKISAYLFKEEEK